MSLFHNNLSELSQDLNMLRHEIVPQLQHVTYYSQSIIGDYKYSARSNDHLGWIFCDGRSLDREQYSGLFEVIGTSFGSSNSTSFMLPDFRGRVPGMIGTGSNLTARSLGAAVGAETHTLTINEIPSHDHGGATGSGGYAASAVTVASGAGIDVADNITSHTHTISAQGGGQAHNNMQPTLFGGKLFIFGGVMLE